MTAGQQSLLEIAARAIETEADAYEAFPGNASTGPMYAAAQSPQD
jgi:hypothetical protein